MKDTSPSEKVNEKRVSCFTERNDEKDACSDGGTTQASRMSVEEITHCCSKAFPTIVNVSDGSNDLGSIPNEDKIGLVEAQVKCNTEEFSDTRLVQFLRCEGMNARVRTWLSYLQHDWIVHAAKQILTH